MAMSVIREKAIEGLKVGDRFSVFRTFAEQDMIRFADISKDYNPVHFNERFAEARKLDGRICHGLLVASLVTEIGGEIGWLASGVRFDFKKPVYFGDTIECAFTITDIDERGRARAEAVLMNQDRSIVLEATLTGLLPGREERQIMKGMSAGRGKR